MKRDCIFFSPNGKDCLGPNELEKCPHWKSAYARKHKCRTYESNVEPSDVVDDPEDPNPESEPCLPE